MSEAPKTHCHAVYLEVEFEEEESMESAELLRAGRLRSLHRHVSAGCDS